MLPNKLKKLIQKGTAESYSAGQVFYSLDFKEELYIVAEGYVKRYSIFEDKTKVLESVYGPGYIFPLTAAYSRLLNYQLGQESGTYVYQAITDVRTHGISSDALAAYCEEDPSLYKDLFYESGVRLKANINRLASNAIKDEYQKVAHQIAYLGEEFGDVKRKDSKTGLRIAVPLEAADMAEQLNLPLEVTRTAMNQLLEAGLITLDKRNIVIPDLDLLRDAYLLRSNSI